MKPDWKDAPEWAEYLAMDENGDWYWYSQKPSVMYPGDDFFDCQGRSMKAGYTPNQWRDTLEGRP